LLLTAIIKKIVMSNNARIVFDFIKKGLRMIVTRSMD